MNPLKSPLAIAISVISLTGCQMLDQSEGQEPRKFKQSQASQFLLEEAKCTLDKAQQESFEVSDRGNLWPRMRDGYGMPDIDHSRIDTYVSWYERHPHYMERVVDRGQRYLYHIATELEERGLPMELALIPIIESAFDPFAYSHGRASGIWQFVPATGRQYGLNQTWWYDGRRDVMASTEAAANYFAYLHGLFDGDWLLAMAAYNAGQGTVGRAIRRNERQGKPTDFWSLPLPRETRAYVPQLLALARVVADPGAYNLTLAPVPDEPYFESVNVDSQIDLAQAAELADMDLNELYMLNPGYNRWATDPDGPHRLLIPTSQAEGFRERLAGVPVEQRVGWRRYEVKPGDSLGTIARDHQTSIDNIRSANDISGNLIRAGQQILIPTAKHPADHYAQSADQRRQRVQSNSGRDGATRVDYEVRPGDSFWKIARRHGTSVGALTNWNGMAPGDTLMPGQSLVIWTDNEALSSQQTNSNQRDMTRRVSYRVRSGDSLARIASRFNVSVRDIMRWNTVSENNYIHPGDSLTLFVDVSDAP